MYCQNALLHHKNPKFFAPARVVTSLCLPYKTVMHFLLINLNPGLELKETKNIAHFLMLEAHSH